ncbi:hypothetical protein FHS85_001964 [Rhodoligotrophos appendicifer]|uniref:hypothetical protein n=1 Tax=Rhodoligotrophos appendicifer TaxID=987056 RepID=UPI0011856123|nr:hypothetical protein [Rhodoligotrophos appendicifer]
MTSDEPRLDFSLAGVPVSLLSRSEEPLKKVTELVLKAEGLESESTARDFGERVKRALLVTSVSTRSGVNLGKDLPTSGWGQTVKDDIFRKFGHRLADNVLGLSVYSEKIPTIYMKFEATGTVTGSPEIFIETMCQYFGDKMIVNDVVKRSVEFLSSAYIEKSHVAKFILAISAIEALAISEARPDAERDLLQIAMAAVDNSDAAIETKKRVSEIIGWQLKEGPTAACKRIVRKYISKEASREFARIYSKRGKILHGDEGLDGLDVAQLSQDATELARSLVLKILEE